uniref:DCC1-like thiol-disulfide oxidoreductase family protein n=1 Tax=Roseihalotalea indica TaxID=2867963 RepID=A0AA49GSZ4_9BACT|nr:DCC1-like thiol-disulfide oxidoreductase family protein [Tunicatimonas sp. TK19036]
MSRKNSDVSIVNKDIILFDGVCNLCNHAVNFIIDRDPANRFVFSSLQSASGKSLLLEHHLHENYLDSLVLIQQGKVFRKSTAALRIAKHLSGLWPLCYVFIILPPFIRNFFYDIVARFRYKWFGKRNECRIPTPELRAKFLD